MTNGEAAVVIRPLYPEPLAPSNYVHDYPENMTWEVRQGPREDLKGMEDYYAFQLPGSTDRVKALTAIILKDSPADKNLPEIERRQGQNWIGLRIRKDGRVTDLYINQLADGRLMHLNSWIEADGWTTDAYLLAVTYREGADPARPDELFIGHGSSLRRGDDVHFSSLSKLNLVSNANGIQATGQPRLHYRLKDRFGTLKTYRTPLK